MAVALPCALCANSRTIGASAARAIASGHSAKKTRAVVPFTAGLAGMGRLGITRAGCLYGHPARADRRCFAARASGVRGFLLVEELLVLGRVRQRRRRGLAALHGGRDGVEITGA